MKSRAAQIGLLIGLMTLAGCQSDGGGIGDFSSFANPESGLQPAPPPKFYPDDQVLQVAKVEFAQGNYGNAQHYFQRSVEVMPNDAEAWLGLAASYDRLRRFDLADRAYREAGRYIGNTVVYLNNRGYSYLLRGDLVRARQDFLKAYELEPANPTVANNLAMLRDSVSYPRRT
ncbi:tetratricopeptide repeat protein [Microbaculum sp. FT89]|uniref:tetratricopeptide repeat protein n=1 Tax=Microbaculum sp. FT89 TaxID=3447298 RepID=UPI003F52E811